MSKLLAAALLAAASLAAPAILVPTHAVEVDCTDPASPASRPGGYCALVNGGSSLAAPVDPPGPRMVVCTADAGTLVLPEGARIRVAVEATEYVCLQSGT